MYSILSGVIIFVLVIIPIIFNPVNVNSAEILLVKDSNTVLLGDQNRNLTINLSCSRVDEKNEFLAIDLLRKNFPRGTKVKIKPLGSKDNKFLAQIYKIKDGLEMTDLLISNQLSENICKS
tara:strand:+ start:4056 stop:4418 length:363 start_codon:yes stop_codon:yes gene_type:complete